MYPEICQIGPFTIYSYGLMLALAFTIGSFLAGFQARKEKINPEIIFNLCFLALVAGVIGARLFYVIENLRFYLKNPWEILVLQHGGLSWFGGLILGFFSSLLYIKRKKLPVYKILDLIIPFVALGQALGRIGCLLNGCCFGKESSWGLYFFVHKATLIPTQLYSSLLLICIFIILRFLQDKPHKEGEVFFTYLLLYSLKRFFIEFWRADNPVIFWGLTLFQILSVIGFFLAMIELVLLKIKKA
ncbi:MAG: prolipoprotein diacylglyceryl transferase [Candidatus Omnitrophica bacterium]|nr:prolipoprotein diacylglyceryl transferase [Candidatus Omnitrophota bacterium]